MVDGWTDLSLRGAGDCANIGGAWQETDGVISTPAGPGVWADDYLHFFRGRAYADFEAEFEFRWQTNHCGTGLILGAQNASDFHLVHFPCCGQHFRAKHFWAAVSKMEKTGWLKILKMDMIRGVVSELGGGGNFVGPCIMQESPSRETR